jgi:hypothetical protein
MARDGGRSVVCEPVLAGAPVDGRPPPRAVGYPPPKRDWSAMTLLT